MFRADALCCSREQLDTAMRFVFGRTFICEDDRDAREITFNKSVDRRDRCVWRGMGGGGGW